MLSSSLLVEQTNDIFQKLNLQKSLLNDEIIKFNDSNDKVKNEFNDWKERLKQKNDANVWLTNEAHKLLFIYEQKMYVCISKYQHIIETHIPT